MTTGTKTRIAMVLAALTALPACGGSTVEDGGVDLGSDGASVPDASDGGETADAGDAGMDAGDAGVDAGDAGVDAGDAGIDAHSDDGDGDGVPTAMDCDDADPLVGTSGSRSCTNECGSGTETCSSGTWGACDAPTDCRCTTPGDTRSHACGMCGLGSQSCGADHVWTPITMCFGEGECADGALEHDSAMCGDSSRLCDATCHWLPWLVTTPPGECEARTSEPASATCAAWEAGTRTCDATCHWGSPTCTTLCVGSPPTTSRTGADPVCVPAGAFVLGNMDIDVESPSMVVTLSQFFIDRFPVTRTRYDMCVTAGACTTPSVTSEYYASVAGDGIVQVDSDNAAAFCVWDGGQLASEFQWEKAARGPSPDMRFASWGAIPASADVCDYHPWSSCTTPSLGFPTTAHPLAVSPYGVRLLGDNREFTRTWYAPDYTGVSPTDPSGPASGTARTARGTDWYYPSFGWNDNPISAVNRTDLATHGAIRCVY